MTDVLFLRSDELTGLATPADYVDAVRKGYQSHGNEGTAEPRTKLVRDDPGGMCTGYLAILPEVGGMGGYTYAAGFGDEDVHFALPLFDAESGRMLALLDGASMNPFKTGATGAVAVDELARPDAEVCAVIGSGAQARGQLKATETVRDFGTVRIFSPTPANREAFATAFDDRLDADVTAVETAAAAVADADVIITATDAGEPVVEDEDVSDGAHITAMGQYDRNKRELQAKTIARATYVPDLRERAFQDAGSFLAAREAGLVDEGHVHAELGEIVAGRRPGRTEAADVTVFDSGGTGIETVAAAWMLYERAREEGLGRTIEFAPGSEALTGE
ncbi:ornithine cyclodeaminase family protein [Natronomonas sp. F2-12]|jgi:alanine dehydrogenase|uniref:Ornithine cyclodeaminase family protein n=1 Tax=Natronomonas aquatica TaxID=2841590 RepID=A0A9R1CT45_9EURY|nr:ornithine cyclodeaminase family protein [Natronomonas aquatica]MCQ4333312.1 ornithine cyclodeaminase family protein [Natronomonas aquatica]